MMADRLGMSVECFLQETTSSQIPMWVEYIERDWQETKREDYHFASLAAEVRRGNVTRAAAKRIKVEDFLLKFTVGEEEPQRIDRQAASAQSKAFWFNALGIKKGK